MFIMKKILLFLLPIFLTLSAKAYETCKKDFYFLQNRKEVNLFFEREIELKTVHDFKKLKSAELKVVKNYINYQEFKFDEDSSLFVSTAQYRLKKDGTSLGYKISVTDGGDESNVNYYLKIDVGIHDIAYLILYRHWDNQSPERDFLCETY